MTMAFFEPDCSNSVLQCPAATIEYIHLNGMSLLVSVAASCAFDIEGNHTLEHFLSENSHDSPTYNLIRYKLRDVDNK